MTVEKKTYSALLDKWLTASLLKMDIQFLEALKQAWESFIFIFKGLGSLAFLKAGGKKALLGLEGISFSLLCIWIYYELVSVSLARGST